MKKGDCVTLRTMAKDSTYQVIARKYRPQLFKEVVGQSVTVTTLKNALRLKKLSHAYLFSGSRGTGKTTLARLFAKAMNCQNLNLKTMEPCNECPSCREILSGQSLDVIEIDGASNRGIDDIRQIHEMVGYVPSHGKYKIYIIDEVHMLTKEAFNALLKTLEEPPERAKFFFATTEPHKILPTILSRCQRFDLSRILPSQIIEKLGRIAKDLSREVEEEALCIIAEHSDGALRDAESLLDQLFCFIEGKVTGEHARQVFGLVEEERFFALDQAFSTSNYPFAFQAVDQFFKEGKDLSHIMEQLISHYRLIALVKTSGESALPTHLAGKYAHSASHYTEAQSLYLFEYLIQAESAFHKSTMLRIHLENTLLHILRSRHRIGVETLVRNLKEMEARLKAEEMPSAQPALEAPQKIPPEPEQKKESVPAKPPEAKKEPLPKKVAESPITTKKIPVEQKEPQTEKQSARHPQSHYDTLMRFAAVELEGSLKT
jgi:DNA polymerase-3 subunit gamma/tau